MSPDEGEPEWVWMKIKSPSSPLSHPPLHLDQTPESKRINEECLSGTEWMCGNSGSPFGQSGQLHLGVRRILHEIPATRVCLPTDTAQSNLITETSL
jgi:hypothetical protein